MAPQALWKTNLQKLDEIKKEIRSLLIAVGSRNVTLSKLNNFYKDITDNDIPFKDFQFTNLKDFLISMPDVVDLKKNDIGELCVYHIDTAKSKHISSLVARQKNTPEQPKYKQRYNFLDPRLLKEIMQECINSPMCTYKKKSIRKEDVLYKISQHEIKHIFYSKKDLNNQLNELTHLLVHDDDFIHFKDKYFYQHPDSVNKNENNVQNEIVCDLIRGSTKERLQKLIKKYPEGIWCSDFPKFYEREYGIDLEYNDLGFNSIIEFVGSLPDIFKIVQSADAKKHKVVDAKTFDNSSQNINKTYDLSEPTEEAEIEALPIMLSSKISKALIPKNVMNIDDTVDQISVTSLFTNLNRDAEVIVTDVFTPSKFWITLRKNKKKISKLMNDLKEFYEYEDLDKYLVPQIVLQPGLHIATTFQEIWHRGIIKEIKPNGYVILFYDYGTEATCNANQIYFLDKRFSFIPAQAIPCSLHNVQPFKKNGERQWKSTICEVFASKVQEEAFIAKLYTINEKTNGMVIDLIDVRYGECINKWMITENLAEKGNMICSLNNFTFEYHQKCLQKINDSSKTKKRETSRIKKVIPNNSDHSSSVISIRKKLEAISKYKARLSNSESSAPSSPTTNSFVEESTVEDKDCLNQKKSVIKQKIYFESNSDLDEENQSTDSFNSNKEIFDEKLDKSIEYSSNSSLSSFSITSESVDDKKSPIPMLKSGDLPNENSTDSTDSNEKRLDYRNNKPTLMFKSNDLPSQLVLPINKLTNSNNERSGNKHKNSRNCKKIDNSLKELQSLIGSIKL